MPGSGGREVAGDGQEELELFVEGRRKPLLQEKEENFVGREGFQSWARRGVGSDRECSGLRSRSRGLEEEGGDGMLVDSGRR